MTDTNVVYVGKSLGFDTQPLSLSHLDMKTLEQLMELLRSHMAR